jgi:transposase
MAFSMEFRVAVATAYQACGSSIEVAEDFPCCASWVRRLIQVQRETGSLEPKQPRRPNNNKLDDADLKLIAELIAAKPDIYLKELAEKLGNKVSVPTLWRACGKLGLPRKKSRCTPRSKTART